MEEASKAKKAKKGFMTPERKKKLRVSISSANMYAFVFHFRVLVAAEKEGRRGAEERTGTQSRRT